MLASSRWRRLRAVRCASTSTRTLARASRSVLRLLCSVRRGGQAAAVPAPQRPAGPAALLSGPRPDALSRHLSPPRLPSSATERHAGSGCASRQVRPCVRPCSVPLPRRRLRRGRAPTATSGSRGRTPAPAAEAAPAAPRRAVMPRSAQAAARTQAERAAAQARPQQAPGCASACDRCGAAHRRDRPPRLRSPSPLTASRSSSRIPRAASGQPSRVGVRGRRREGAAGTPRRASTRQGPRPTRRSPTNRPVSRGSQTARPAGRGDARAVRVCRASPLRFLPGRHPSSRRLLRRAPSRGWARPQPGSLQPERGSRPRPVRSSRRSRPRRPGTSPLLLQPAAPAQPSAVGYSAAAPLPASFQPAAGSDDEPGVFAWDAVPGGEARSPRRRRVAVLPVAAPEQPGEEIDEEPVTNDSWLGYTPFHYVILVVIGLVLGFVCWQAFSATSTRPRRPHQVLQWC